MVLQGLRVHCRGMTEWHKMLAPIAAAYKASVVPSRGASPYKLMFGVDMRLPVETALAKDLPAHRRPTENIELMAKQMTTMRTQAQSLAQDSRQRAVKTANKHKQSTEFNPGDRVYKVRDALGESDDRKTASKFQGPYVILERGKNDVYKLANFYTGKILKNFIHADKLKNCQSARAARNKRPTITIINTHASSKCDDTRMTTRPRPTCDADNRQRAGGVTNGVNADTSGGSGHGDHDPISTDPLGTASCAVRRAATSKTRLMLDELHGSNDNAHETVRTTGDAEIEPVSDRDAPKKYRNAHDDSDSRTARGTPRHRHFYLRPTRTGRNRSAAKTDRAGLYRR